MKAYFVDNKGFFVGVREVKEIVPGAITEKPPETWPPDVPKWNGTKWIIVQDYRGIYYDTITQEKHKIDELGEQPDPAWTKELPSEPGPEEKVYWNGTAWKIIAKTAEELAVEKQTEYEQRAGQELGKLFVQLTEADDPALPVALKTAIRALKP